jgi:hypothetical protein
MSQQQLQARHRMPQQLRRLNSDGERKTVAKMNTFAAAPGGPAAAERREAFDKIVQEEAGPLRGILLKRQDALHPGTTILQQQVSLQEPTTLPQQQVAGEEDEEIEVVEVEYSPHSPLSTPPPTPPYVHKKFNNPPNSPVQQHHPFPRGGKESVPANNNNNNERAQLLLPTPRLNSIAEILDDLSGPTPLAPKSGDLKDAWAPTKSRDPRSGARSSAAAAAAHAQCNTGLKRSANGSEQDPKKIRTFSRQVPILFNILRQNASCLVNDRRRSFYQARFIFKPFRNEYASAGFYYTGFGDNCTCFASGCFARVDNHAEAWLKHSEKCSFLLMAAPSHIQPPIESLRKRDINFDDPSYYYVRLRSFDGMLVRGNPVWFSPSKMAEAGFVRNGDRRIECFACHVQFDDETEDIVCARAAHRNWNSDCAYLKMTV